MESSEYSFLILITDQFGSGEHLIESNDCHSHRNNLVGIVHDVPRNPKAFMKLVIVTRDGEAHDVIVGDLEQYNLSKPLARSEIIDEIQSVINELLQQGKE
jgi:hypothetical protein